jgi:predicted nucleic acid-binding protein
MNIYVETNFVLELVFEQEYFDSCEQILSLCESAQTQLFIPAYCLAEPLEKLSRQAENRRGLQIALNAEMRQLVRTQAYAEHIQSIANLRSLLVQSNEEEKQRFSYYRNKLLSIGQIIPLTAQIVQQAAALEGSYDLRPQDALVYVSVLDHLRLNKPSISCFLNRNSKDFDIPEIVKELSAYNCTMIPQFNHGYRFIQTRLQR